MAQNAWLWGRGRGDNLNPCTGSTGMVRSITIILNLVELILTNSRGARRVTRVTG
jgi:hypothetical protein